VLLPSGPLLPDISELRTLKTLDLSHNVITGEGEEAKSGSHNLTTGLNAYRLSYPSCI
jgi:hypothetical protein